MKALDSHTRVPAFDPRSLVTSLDLAFCHLISLSIHVYLKDTYHCWDTSGNTNHMVRSNSGFVNDVVHGLVEIDTASSKTPKDGGFNSGTQVKNGR